MRVYVCIYMYPDIKVGCVCIYIWGYIYIYMCVYLCIYICLWVWTHAHTVVRTCIYVAAASGDVYICVYRGVCMCSYLLVDFFGVLL
jgi:hypothetical protein